MSQGSEIGTLTRLLAEHLRNYCFIPSWVKKFILLPQHSDRLWGSEYQGFLSAG